VLCLGIVAVLWLSFGILSFGLNMSISQCLVLPVLQYFNLFAAYLLAFGLWFLVKPFILTNQKAKTIEEELHNFVSNPVMFKAYLQKQQNVGVQTWDNEIVFGNVASPLSVIIVTNPFCKPCGFAHKELMEWGKYYEAKIIYRLTPNEEEKDHEGNRFIKHLWSITDTEIQEQALHDWYETKKYDIWAKKYPVEIFADAENQLRRHANWVKFAQITQTPTIFMNGYELKEPYNFTQLKYLLKALIEE
jgi:protein-disulfide isomerase